MKKLILEVLSLYEEEMIVEKLLKKHLYIVSKKEGGILIKLVKKDQILKFDPYIEEDLDSLYDHLFPIVKNEIEFMTDFSKGRYENINVKRIYDLIKIVIDKIIHIFTSNKKNVPSIYKFLSNKINFIPSREYRNVMDMSYDDERLGINTEQIKRILSDIDIESSVNKYFNAIKNLYRIVSKKVGLTYRESKDAIIKIIDDAVKEEFGLPQTKNLSDIVRSYGYRID